MDRRRIYDYLADSRQRIFDAVRSLESDAYTRDFSVGPGTIGKTLTHLLISEWYYIQRINESPVPPYDEWPIRDDAPPPFGVIERTWKDQANATRATFDASRDWDAAIEYTLINDEGEREIVTATPSDIATQLILHEMHHRAQLLHMLRQCGAVIDDIDFNLAVYDRRPAE